MKKTTIIAVLLLAVVFNVQAEDRLSPSHMAVAREYAMLSAPDDVMRAVMKMSAETGIKRVVESNEAAQPYAEDIVDGYVQVVLSFTMKQENLDKYRKAQTEVLAEAFTESEIREILRFFKSPTGKKLVAKIPENFEQVLLKSQAISIEIEKSPEYQEALGNMVARLKQDGKLPEDF